MSSLYGSFFCFRYWETMGLIYKGKGSVTPCGVSRCL